MHPATKATKEPLAVSQRLLRGLATTFFESGIAVLEGVVLFYYNDKKKVSTEYLGLANFVMAVLTVYVSVLVGNIGDRSTSIFRRKPMIMIFTPLYAAGIFFRFGAFTSEENAPIYYAVTLAMQVIGKSGAAITNDAWNMELSNEEVDRSKLYSTMTAVGVVGILLGLGMIALPLVISAVIISVGVIGSLIANIMLIPEGTPMEKRCFVPMVTNISSVAWNSQYRIYLGTLSCVWFLNSVPPLLMFFLRFAVGQNEDGAELSYTFCLAAFILIGFLALPCIPKLIEFRGKIFTANIALYGVMICGVLMLGASYLSPYAVIGLFGIVGFFATLSNTVFSIIAADIVDYDELLTGMKRAASYTGVTNLPYMFISTGGSSIPLVLMSVLGFKEPPIDDDVDDDGDSTEGSTAVLRIWCSLFLSILGVAAFLIFKNYKIDNKIHMKVLENISKRDDDAASAGEEYPVREVSKMTEADDDGIHLKDVFLANSTRAYKRNITASLNSVDDPITENPVVPPPFITTGAVLYDVVSNGSQCSLPVDERDAIRLLGEYFPSILILCSNSSGRQRLLFVALWKYFVYFVLLVLGIWQSVEALIREDEYGSYLIVLLTTVYSVFFAWEVLFVKGYLIIKYLKNSPNLNEIEGYLLKAGEELHKNQCLSSSSQTDENLRIEENAWLVRTTALVTFILVTTFIGAFVILNA